MNKELTRRERVAALFVLVSVGILITAATLTAIQQGWFMSNLTVRTTLPRGNGIRPGSIVYMLGLPAGRIDNVGINSDKKVEVEISISHNFRHLVREDSYVNVSRATILGDKVVDISMGSDGKPLVANNGLIVGGESLDLLDFIGNKKMDPYMDTIEKFMLNLKVLADAFGEPKRSEAMIRLFDEALPTLTGLHEMSSQLTDNGRMRVSLKNIIKLTEEVNKMLPAITEFSKHLPELGTAGSKTLQEMALLTEEMNKIMPIMVEMAPQFPEISQDGAGVLKEALVVLQAMQKSFLLRSSVQEVKEESKAKKESQRVPSHSQEKPIEKAP